jgi:hypothetical protein
MSSATRSDSTPAAWAASGQSPGKRPHRGRRCPAPARRGSCLGAVCPAARNATLHAYPGRCPRSWPLLQGRRGSQVTETLTEASVALGDHDPFSVVHRHRPGRVLRVLFTVYDHDPGQSAIARMRDTQSETSFDTGRQVIPSSARGQKVARRRNAGTVPGQETGGW